MVVGVGNNLKNDLRGIATVNDWVIETGAKDSETQLNGGRRGFQLVGDLAFPGIDGFRAPAGDARCSCRVCGLIPPRQRGAGLRQLGTGSA